MSNKLVHGYAWVTYPDVFGLEPTEKTDPGHPFAFGPGGVSTPAEVVFYRPASTADAGVRNEFHPNSYLVLTKNQLHPRVSTGWESDPAVLTENFKSEDGKVKMLRIIGVHHRNRAGDLMECEMKVEEA
jgi:hypothetical protein